MRDSDGPGRILDVTTTVLSDFRVLVRTGVLIVAAVAGSGCHSPGPTAPPPPTTLLISCPADLNLQSEDGISANRDVVSLVQVTGGTPPTTKSCPAGASGVFPVGSTPVTCQANDSAGQSTSCAFTVRVTAIPRLRYTKLLAFGDSITYGTDALPVATTMAVLVPWSYPSNLATTLGIRYPLQTFTVANAGKPGEQVDDPDTLDRFRLEYSLAQPELVILLEGTNDLKSIEDVDPAIDAMERLIGEARNQGSVVVLGSLLPPRPSPLRETLAELVPVYNERLRDVALVHDATYVDLYTSFAANMSLIGDDDLHPTKEGYVKMAELFADALMKFETIGPATTSPGVTMLRGALARRRAIASRAR